MEDENKVTEEIIEDDDIEVSEDAESSGKYDRLLESDSRKFKLSGMFKDWYLDYASYVILHRAVPHIADGLKPAFPGCLALYRRGIFMNVTNPKVSIFFLAFLPQFCDPARGSVAWQCLQLGLVFMLATLVAFSSAALLAGHIFSRFNRLFFRLRVVVTRHQPSKREQQHKEKP